MNNASQLLPQTVVAPQVNGRWSVLLAAFGRALKLRSTSQGFMGWTPNGDQVTGEWTHGNRVDWLVLRTPICGQNDMDPVQTLERNGELAFAAIVLLNGVYFFRVALPFDSSELNDPSQLVGLLVAAAHSLWPHRVAPPSEITTLFQHYAD